MQDIDSQKRFLQSRRFAVAGASTDRSKYGNLVLRALMAHVAGDVDRHVDAINPRAENVEGLPAHDSIGQLPQVPDAISIVTPPEITRGVVQQAIEAGVATIWMQPGAEDAAAIESAEAAGIEVIAGGPCLLVALKTLA